MKKIIAVSVFTAFIMGVASNASAFWSSNDDYECYGPYGKIPGCNSYDEWDPRYWMEEMEDMFDDDDDDYYRGGYGRGGYGQPYGGGYAPASQPYYGNPYAAPAPAPVAPAAPQQ
ncbi:MAG: hypothetical protein KZQ57_10275 [gamma proteobacterium symbiont of Lucinoma myriamae]|nr:hypothetical protein [gamma proteobacterium symbiont of Lucinoma myriamae]